MSANEMRAVYGGAYETRQQGEDSNDNSTKAGEVVCRVACSVERVMRKGCYTLYMT